MVIYFLLEYYVLYEMKIRMAEGCWKENRNISMIKLYRLIKGEKEL